MKKLLAILVISLFISCESASHIQQPRPIYSGKQDTSVLGTLYLSSKKYTISTKFKRVKLADSYKNKSLLIFKSQDSETFIYNVNDTINFPYSLKGDSLFFRNGVHVFTRDFTFQDILCLDFQDECYSAD